MSIFSGIINSTLRDIYNDGEIEMWRGLAIPCTIIYAPTKIPCSNCVDVTIGGFTGNISQDGMSLPGFAEFCPYCAGTGYKEVSETSDVRMQINVDPRSFLGVFKPMIIESPQNFLESKARLEDLPALLKCVEVIINTNLSGYKEARYSRASEAVPSGMFQNKFCHILWKRNG